MILSSGLTNCDEAYDWFSEQFDYHIWTIDWCRKDCWDELIKRQWVYRKISIYVNIYIIVVCSDVTSSLVRHHMQSSGKYVPVV